MGAGSVRQNAFAGKFACFSLNPSVRMEGVDIEELDAAQIKTLGAGLATYADAVAATETSHLLLAADADEVYFLVGAKSDLWYFDLSRDLMLDIVYVHTGTDATDDPIFSAEIKGYADGQAYTDCKVSADGAITFATDTDADGSDAFNVTTRQGFGVAGAFVDDVAIGIAITLDAISTAEVTELHLIEARLWGTLGLWSSTDRPEYTSV